jgi:hypothetical protein
MPAKPNPRHHHIDKRAVEVAAQPVVIPDDLLSTTQVAGWLDVSPQFLETARHRGYGPKYLRLSPRRIRYRRQDVLNWLSERAHSRTSEYQGETS